MHAAEGGIRGKHELPWTKYKFYDPRWRGSYDKQVVTRGALYGISSRKLFKFGKLQIDQSIVTIYIG